MEAPLTRLQVMAMPCSLAGNDAVARDHKRWRVRHSSILGESNVAYGILNDYGYELSCFARFGRHFALTGHRIHDVGCAADAQAARRGSCVTRRSLIEGSGALMEVFALGSVSGGVEAARRRASDRVRLLFRSLGRLAGGVLWQGGSIPLPARKVLASTSKNSSDTAFIWKVGLRVVQRWARSSGVRSAQRHKTARRVVPHRGPCMGRGDAAVGRHAFVICEFLFGARLGTPRYRTHYTVLYYTVDAQVKLNDNWMILSSESLTGCVAEDESDDDDDDDDDDDEPDDDD